MVSEKNWESFKQIVNQLIHELADVDGDQRRKFELIAKVEENFEQMENGTFKPTSELKAGDDCPFCRDGTLILESRDIDRLVHEYLACEFCLYDKEI